MMNRKFGDRRDGTRIKMDGFLKFMYCLKSKRNENEVYINREIDVTNLKRYYEDKKKKNSKLTYFHLFSTAIAKVIYNEPYLNRFIINKKLYQRNEVTLSFVAKTEFTDEASELLTVLRIKEDDNLEKISDKISGNVSKIRSNKGNNTDDFVAKLRVLPNFVMSLVIKVIRFLDNHDLLPKSLTKNSIYHSTVLLSNLGSIHCGGIYHNLTNFGTNSVVVTIGEITEKPVLVDGIVESRYMCAFGITLDERIGDGVYFSKCINLLEYILNNPSMLEDDVNARIDTDKNK